MESYSGLNRTIVIDALRSGQILDTYLREEKNIPVALYVRTLNPTSYSNLTALLNLRLWTSWTSSSSSTLPSLKASNALPFFLTYRVQVIPNPGPSYLLFYTMKPSCPRPLHGLPILTSQRAQLLNAQRNYSWPYYIKYNLQALITLLLIYSLHIIYHYNW